ncbi:hypothetical protein ACB013_17850 [Acinetobacter baumannii]|nr:MULTISPECIES: hypothetical protein [Acinetobacter]MDP7919539.1 hypothetical protein [Acinetobacter baumannii]
MARAPKQTKQEPLEVVLWKQQTSCARILMQPNTSMLLSTAF